MFIENNYLNSKIQFIKSDNKFNEINKIKEEELKKREVAEDFASLFTQMLLKELRKSLHEENNPLYGGFTEEVFKDMLYEEYSKAITKQGLKPLVDLIYSSVISHSSGM